MFGLGNAATRRSKLTSARSGSADFSQARSRWLKIDRQIATLQLIRPRTTSRWRHAPVRHHEIHGRAKLLRGPAAGKGFCRSVWEARFAVVVGERREDAAFTDGFFAGLRDMRVYRCRFCINSFADSRIFRSRQVRLCIPSRAILSRIGSTCSRTNSLQTTCCAESDADAASSGR